MWGAIAAIGGSILGSLFASKATKDAADTNADAIRDAQRMTDERYQQVRQDALSLFDSAMSSTYQGVQDARSLILSGQASTQDVLNQAYSGAAQTLQTSGQQAINAILGGQPPTLQNVQQAEAQLPTGLEPEQASGEQDFIDMSGATQPVPGEFSQGDAPQQFGQISSNRKLGQPIGENDFGANVTRGLDIIPQGPEQFYSDLPSQQQALEGEFIPAGYDLPQTGLNIPQSQMGLSGAEQALRSGGLQSRFDLSRGTAAGLQGLGRELGFAGEEVRRGRDFGLGEIRSAMDTGRGDIRSALAGGRRDISEAAQQGASSALSGAQQGVSFLSPYMQAGQEALDPYLALSGVRGQEAFDEALINDPAYQLLLERSEQALGRQAALTGGIGGGNIAAELQRNAQMQGAADIDRQLGRSGRMIDVGRGAAGTAGGFTTQAGIAAGGMQAQAGRDLSGLGQRASESMANIAMSGGRDLSRIGINASSQIADLARTMGISENQAMQVLGQNLGQGAIQQGQQIGNLRNLAGLNVAQTLTGQGQQQAGLQTGLGQQLGGLDQQTAINLSNQASQYGGAQAGLQTGLASLLANAGAGQASQQANLGLNLGQAQAAGVTNPIGNSISTLTGLYTANPDLFSGFGNQSQALR